MLTVVESTVVLLNVSERLVIILFGKVATFDKGAGCAGGRLLAVGHDPT